MKNCQLHDLSELDLSISMSEGSVGHTVAQLFKHDPAFKRATVSAVDADKAYPGLVKRLLAILTKDQFPAKLLKVSRPRFKLDKATVAPSLEKELPHKIDHAVVVVNNLVLDPCRLRLGSHYDVPTDYAKRVLTSFWDHEQDVTKISQLTPEEVKEMMLHHKPETVIGQREGGGEMEEYQFDGIVPRTGTKQHHSLNTQLIAESAAISVEKYVWMKYKGARAVNLTGSDMKIVPEAVFGVRAIRGSDNDEYVLMTTSQKVKVHYTISNRILNKSAEYKGKIKLGSTVTKPAAPVKPTVKAPVKSPVKPVVKQQAASPVSRYNGRAVLKKLGWTAEELTKLRITKVFAAIPSSDFLLMKAYLTKQLKGKPKLQEWLITEFKSSTPVKQKPTQVKAPVVHHNKTPVKVVLPKSGKVELAEEDEDEDNFELPTSYRERKTKKHDFDVPELDVHDLPTEFDHIRDNYDSYSKNVKLV